MEKERTIVEEGIGETTEKTFVEQQKRRLEEERIALDNERIMLSSPRSIRVNSERDPSWEPRLLRVNSKINDIDIALQRIKNNIYLKCVQCGKNIETQSLKVCPARRICCSCAPKDGPPKKSQWKINGK